MKKNTIIFSGVMAAILTTGAANAAVAKIASQEYVDRQNTAQTTTITENITNQVSETLKSYPTTEQVTTTITNEINTAIAEGGAIDEALADYATTADLEKKVDTTTMTTELDKKADKTAIADMETKTSAAATYAVKATEGVANTATQDATKALTAIGTLTELTTTAKGNVVAAVNEIDAAVTANGDAITAAQTAAEEAASAATAAQAAATAAQTAASAAQGDVDALEAVVTNETTGLAATKTIADNAATAAAGAKTAADAAQADVDALEGVVTNATTGLAATKTIADNALAATQTNATEIAKKVNYTDLGALATAAPGECADAESKCVLTFNGTAYGWEVIAR